MLKCFVFYCYYDVANFSMGFFSWCNENGLRGKFVICFLFNEMPGLYFF